MTTCNFVITMRPFFIIINSFVSQADSKEDAVAYVNAMFCVAGVVVAIFYYVIEYSICGTYVHNRLH